jgi:hypothetical protein
MLKLNKLLYYTADRRVFSDEIEPTDEQRKELTKAKNDIRDHLRVGISEATVTKLGMPRRVQPRFRTQGSWSYNTCIQPFAMPPQEMDWDFGVYLPVDVWEDKGPPHAMAKAYFVLVEGLLESLCEEKGWHLVPGKDTCIRVQVASWGHVDLPLYAAPAEQFVRIQERALAKAVTASVHDSVRLSESAEFGEFPEQAWEELDDIMIACRSGEWIKSDPEAVSRWFNDQVLVHTEQLRRVCRYVKAWRDKWWESGGPTSVSLMIAIAQEFDAKAGRDDRALEGAMRALAKALKGDIRALGIDGGKEDFNRLKGIERELAAQKAQETAAAIQRARLRGEDGKAQAVADLRGELGTRVPNDTELVDVDTVAQEVLSVAPRKVTAPVVLATNAG